MQQQAAMMAHAYSQVVPMRVLATSMLQQAAMMAHARSRAVPMQ
jgi:hypothetical protein